MGICGNRGGEFDHLKIKNLNAQGLTGEILKFLFDRYIKDKICRCLRNAIGPDTVTHTTLYLLEKWKPKQWNLSVFLHTGPIYKLS